MPIATTPVKEAILNNIQGITSTGAYAATGLGLLVAPTYDGNHYYTEVQRIQKIDAGPMDLKEFPAIVIVPVTTDYDNFGTQGTTTIAGTYIIQLSLIMRSRTGAVKEMEQFVRDAHKAVLIDRQRDGNAISTRASSDEVFYPADDEPYVSANLILEVDYRTRWNDLNSPT
tara:strand:- start:586 stop:1098 length:513 start_codon:yes stop_codon:yes gene_type:complete